MHVLLLADTFIHSRKAILIFALFFIIFLSLTNAPVSFSQTASNNKTNCNCVIFRLDDVQDYYLNRTQLAVMNLFLEQNQPLSLGLISNLLGGDNAVVNEIRNGFHAGKFELASHGWNHENFSKFGEQDQFNLLNNSSEKIQKIFGFRPSIFIPPEFQFSNATLDAMRQLGIKIISSDFLFYSDRNQSSLITKTTYSNYTANDEVFHFPNTLLYSYMVTDKLKTPPVERWETPPVEQLISLINKSISTYGYAVVTMHPQGFAATLNGKLTNALNETKLTDLKTLVDDILDHKLRITSFNKIANMSSAYVNPNALFARTH